MFRMLAVAALVVAMGATPHTSHAQDAALIVKESSTDFATTVQRLQAEIEARGAKIVAVVDHSAAAKANGLELPPTTLIIFGNPKLGTPLMQEQRTAGLDLPLRILTWEEADGSVRIGYWPPTRIAASHGIQDRDEVIDKMTGALAAITDAAAGQ
jgi:uncharacterized protein (DUF302 family)